MHIEEIDQYKVACHVFQRDLKPNGIMVEDIVNRTPLAHIFFQKVGRLARESTEYKWPGCASSMTMEFYPDEIVLTFSERIEDYLYNLQQTGYALSGQQADFFQQLIDKIRESSEEEARTIIKNFEQNVRDAQ